jgi:hypothetical protein
MNKKNKTLNPVIVAITSCLMIGLTVFWYRHINIPAQNPIINELRLSARSREQLYTQRYLDQKIPTPVAQLAATVERYEHDRVIIQEELGQTTEELEKSELTQALITADQELIELLNKNRPMLDKYAEKAVRNHNANLFKIVTILRSCSFLFERTG